MPTRYLIANWKMQLSPEESADLARKIIAALPPEPRRSPDARIVFCPSHLALGAVAEAVAGSGVAVGAQDCFWEDKGAYTGEISPVSLKELGCSFCIVGHSERRQNLNESDEMVRRKVAALLRHDLNPIVCVGETREERERGQRDAVIVRQVRAALAEGETRPVGHQRVIIAYEPVWVIGSGRAVEPDDAAAAHQLILHALQDMYSADAVRKYFSVIYGGSADAKNFGGFLEMPIIEGALVGGASLKPDEFVRMAEML